VDEESPSIIQQQPSCISLSDYLEMEAKCTNEQASPGSKRTLGEDCPAFNDSDGDSPENQLPDENVELLSARERRERWWMQP
jgi:hypothetical protein